MTYGLRKQQLAKVQEKEQPTPDLTAELQTDDFGDLTDTLAQTVDVGESGLGAIPTEQGDEHANVSTTPENIANLLRWSDPEQTINIAEGPSCSHGRGRLCQNGRPWQYYRSRI